MAAIPAGADLIEVSKALGHSTPALTAAHYADHFDAQRARLVFTTIGELVTGQIVGSIQREGYSQVTTSVGEATDTQRAIDWVRRSLAQGSSLAATIDRVVSAIGTGARILVPRARDRGRLEILDNIGRGVAVADAEEIARMLLVDMARSSQLTLIVEDDLACKGDPHVGDAAFVDDRVLRWEQVQDDAHDATRLLRLGASGYPLNAYVCIGNPDDLGLMLGDDLSTERQQRIAEALRAVIVSVWDGEAFVALLTSPPGSSRQMR